MQDKTKTRDEIGTWVIEYQGRISIEADALVMVRGTVTRRAIHKLIHKLELMSEDYPDEAETPEHEAQQSAASDAETAPRA